MNSEMAYQMHAQFWYPTQSVPWSLSISLTIPNNNVHCIGLRITIIFTITLRDFRKTQLFMFTWGPEFMGNVVMIIMFYCLHFWTKLIIKLRRRERDNNLMTQNWHAPNYEHFWTYLTLPGTPWWKETALTTVWSLLQYYYASTNSKKQMHTLRKEWKPLKPKENTVAVETTNHFVRQSLKQQTWGASKPMQALPLSMPLKLGNSRQQTTCANDYRLSGKELLWHMMAIGENIIFKDKQ